MTNMNCIVLGADGFIGTALCSALIKRGASVTAFGRKPQPRPGFDPNARWICGDFPDAPVLEEAIVEGAVVFHLISGLLPHNSNQNPIRDVELSTVATLRLLDICVRKGVRKIVFASSGGTIYGIPTKIPITEHCPTDPISAYGISKLACEKYLALFFKLHGLDYAAARISNPFGPFQLPGTGQGIIANVLAAGILNTAVPIWGTGQVVRDFIYVHDAAAALVECALYTGPVKIMNVSSGVGRSINSIVEDCGLVLGTDIPVRRFEARAEDVPVSVLDNALLMRELKWDLSTTWNAGLAEAAEWMKAHLSTSR